MKRGFRDEVINSGGKDTLEIVGARGGAGDIAVNGYLIRHGGG